MDARVFLVPAMIVLAPRSTAGADDGGVFNALAVSADGALAAAGGKGGSVVLFDLEKGRARRTLAAGAVVNGLAFAPDGRRLAVAADGDEVKTFERREAEGEFAASRSVRVRGGAPSALAFSPDGKTLAVGVWGSGSIHLLDPASGERVGGVWEPSNGLSTLRFSPDGKALASAGNGFKMWDVRPETLRVVEKSLRPGMSSQELEKAMRTALTFDRHDRSEYGAAAAFSPDGKLLATVSGIGGNSTGGKTFTLWEVAGARKRHERPSTGLRCVIFTPDGKRVLTGSDDGIVRVWDAATAEIVRETAAHEKAVREIVFVPGTALVATAGEEGTITLWEAGSGKLIKTLPGE